MCTSTVSARKTPFAKELPGVKTKSLVVRNHGYRKFFCGRHVWEEKDDITMVRRSLLRMRRYVWRVRVQVRNTVSEMGRKRNVGPAKNGQCAVNKDMEPSTYFIQWRYVVKPSFSSSGTSCYKKVSHTQEDKTRACIPGSTMIMV